MLHVRVSVTMEKDLTDPELPRTSLPSLLFFKTTKRSWFPVQGIPPSDYHPHPLNSHSILGT
jgi:hypothetical protein